MASMKFVKKSKGRFVESLDQTRFDPIDIKQNKLAYIYAEIEVLFCLLFGENILTSEAMSFDSGHFIKILYRVIQARDSNIDNKNTLLHDNPFKVSLQKDHIKVGKSKEIISAPFNKMLAGYFAQYPKDKENRLFILSSFPELNSEENFGLREEISTDFRKGKIEEARKKLEKFNEKHAVYLNEVCNYFNYSEIVNQNKCEKAITNLTLLQKNLNEITKISPQNPHLTITNSQLSKSEIDLHYLDELLCEIKDGYLKILELEKKEDNNVKILNRSIIHKYKNSDILSPEVFEGVLEFVDDCYNRTIATLISADTGQFSTRGNPENPYVKASDLFCREFSRLGSGNLYGLEESETSLIIPQANEILPKEQTNKVLSEQISDIGDELIDWKSVWAVLRDTEFQESLINLRKQIGGKSEEYNAKLREEALIKHKELLAEKLKGEYWLDPRARSQEKSTFDRVKQKSYGDAIGVILYYIVAELVFRIPIVGRSIEIISKNIFKEFKSKSVKDGIIQGLKRVE